MPEQRPGEEPPRPESEEQHGHREEGLELARSIARGLAGKTGLRRKAKPPSVGEGRRSGPSRPSGAHPDERDPQTLDTNIERLVAQAGWGEDLRVHGVFSRWSAIVGRDVAEHCTPESYADGRLVVRTDSTAWATQLKLLAGTLVRRLNDDLGDETVRVIDVEPPRGPSWRKGRLRVKGRGPRDTYG
ncbi:MAG: hypothetical protein JWO46_2198 [Nocardioidaceae bacterium]|nr:hypothetical protein [Nocardioidaceae bacterium]